MSSPHSTESGVEASGIRFAGLSESTEAEEHSYSVTGSDSNVGELESDTYSVSMHSAAHQYDEDSVNYMGHRRSSAKKQTLIISKLKSELAHARNTIAMARMNDTVILKTKLRAAETDLNRARIQNVELKENIEKLELRLFELLSSNSQRAAKKSAPAQPPGRPDVSPADKLEKSIEPSVGSARIVSNSKQTDIQGENVQAMQSKEQLWLQRRKATKLDDLLLPLPQELSQDIQSHLKHAIERAAEADRKTINELISELHRLEDVVQGNDGVKKCDRATTMNTEVQPNKDEKIQPTTGVSLDDQTYSQRELLYSFFAGAVVMIFSVILSSFRTPGAS